LPIGDGPPNYLLVNTSTRSTVIWYSSRATHTRSRTGPTVVPGYDAVGLADFDANGRPDYLLYNSATQQTTIWYMNDKFFIHNVGGSSRPQVGAWSRLSRPSGDCFRMALRHRRPRDSGQPSLVMTKEDELVWEYDKIDLEITFRHTQAGWVVKTWSTG
jgi:hypothetical protein